MANNGCVYQQEKTVSIPKIHLEILATTENLKKKDYQVLLMLFCQLNGVRRGSKISATNNTKYSKIDVKSIASTLHLEKKDVKKSIDKLEELGFIEKGSSGTVENGYIFTF